MHQSKFRVFSLLGLPLASALLGANAYGVTVSGSDAFTGSTVNATDPFTADPAVVSGLTTAADGSHLFNGIAGGGGNENTFYKNNQASYFTEFTRNNSTPLSGVTVFAAGDAGADISGTRSIATFSLLADNDNNGSFETILVPAGAPANDASGTTFNFPVVSTATHFRSEVTPGPTGFGPRLQEIDAVSVPEPTTMMGLAIGSIALLSRRRRRRQNV